ncbi:MAG: MBOAT family protein [Bacteroidetes bacterium]|nr:MBOAT family protein [Bacteroidota bacterium]MBU1718396.1 MBOAT family protein [Bacteroidota bacterium]
MVFSSLVFLFLFLPITLLVYYLSPRQTRNAILLGFSLLFYAWGEVEYILVLLSSITSNYFLGRLLDKAETNRKLIFGLIVTFNLGLIVWFKYMGFIAGNLSGLAGMTMPESLANIHLPLGISFFTFQSLSYQYDLYRKEIQVEKNFINLGLYVAMFSQLVAGPIVRYVDVHRQIRKRTVNAANFRLGIQRFITGLAKKVLIANSFGAFVAEIRLIPTDDMSSSVAIAMVVAYAFQIFFDFSGYSDMAIGLGKMFGFTFLENFNYPYIARSIREFWRRWHISLSTWFRDYLYIPLGGSRKGNTRTYFNLILVFFLTGLWHGAQWNFIAWGLFHGFFLIVERLISLKSDKLHVKVLSHAYTLLVVLAGWVFFMTDSVQESFLLFARIADIQHFTNPEFPLCMILSNEMVLLFVVATLISMPIFFNFRYLTKKIYKKYHFAYIRETIRTTKLALYMALLIISISYLAAGTFNPFIYFRF